MDNVVYTQVYLEEIGKYGEMDRVFGEYFSKVKPARAVLGVARVPESPIEITAVAVRDLSGPVPSFRPITKQQTVRRLEFSHATGSLFQA
jgi:hypothetical protein